MGVRQVLAIAFVIGASALAQSQPQMTLARVSGYLAPGEFDVTHVIEPAPRPGDPRYETDREIFKQTRKLVGTPRYALATSDADLKPASMLRNFSCSVGVQLTPDNAPRTLAVIQRASADTGGQSGKAKDFYQRERPFVVDPGQKICQAPEELFDKKINKESYDYPSGHTTAGWTYALVLASLAPDHAQAILQRGRAYGESRFVCGAHNESAVEGGMLSASATMALVETKPAYQADLKAAKEELDGLRAKGGSAPTGCAEESALIAQRVMPRLKNKP